jgi:diguanylate cyclase (GGDEF)-like protein
MSIDSRPLRPPEPTFKGSAPLAGPEETRLRARLMLQRDRALVYTIAGLVTLLSKVTGAVDFNYRASLGVLAAGFLSVAFFSLLEVRARRANRRVSLAPWWISCDVILITAMVSLTGGTESDWYLWYVACAGAAAAHCSLRFSLVGAGFTTLLYLGALVGMGQIHGLDRELATASTQLLFLFGASFFLLLNTRKLRQSVGVNRRLKEEAVTRVEELTRVTEDLEAMSRLLRNFTETDPLTGLHNRRYFMDRIAEDARRMGGDRRASGQRPSAGIMMIDLDHFKTINDTRGHSAGDAVLKHLAKVLRRCVRSEDRLVRWGGEEFLILLPRARPERTREVAERVVRAVRSEPCPFADGSFQEMSCSVGWSAFDWQPRKDGAPPWESAMAAADEALYAAKADGRNRSRGLQPEQSSVKEVSAA